MTISNIGILNMPIVDRGTFLSYIDLTLIVKTTIKQILYLLFFILLNSLFW